MGTRTKKAKRSKKAKKRNHTLRKKDCSRCTRKHGEAFWCFGSNYVFDVDAAREFTAHRETIELEPEDVEYSVDRCQINTGHLAHVDPTIPGIVAHVFFRDDDGSLHRGTRLIDGHHRAARCLQLGIPYYVRILTAEESIKALMKAPPGARPVVEREEYAPVAQAG